MKIVIINGPNLNLLGKREPEIYGRTTFEEYFEGLKRDFSEVEFEYFQSNHEGDIIDKLQEVGFDDDTAILLNAGGYTHTSVAIADAVRAIPATVVEIHISDTSRREPFRQYSFLKDVCDKRFVGYGLDSYRKGVEALIVK